MSKVNNKIVLDIIHYLKVKIFGFISLFFNHNRLDTLYNRNNLIWNGYDEGKLVINITIFESPY